MAVRVDKDKCISCFGCISVCPVMALKESKRYPECDPEKCTSCGTCLRFCPVGALRIVKEEKE